MQNNILSNNQTFDYALPNEVLDFASNINYGGKISNKLKSNDGYKYIVVISIFAKSGIPFKDYIESIKNIETIMQEDSEISNIIRTLPRKFIFEVSVTLGCFYSGMLNKNGLVSYYLITYLYLAYNGFDSIPNFIGDKYHISSMIELIYDLYRIYENHTIYCISTSNEKIPHIYKIIAYELMCDINGKIIKYIMRDESIQRINGDKKSYIRVISPKTLEKILNSETDYITKVDNENEKIIPFLSKENCLNYYKKLLNSKKIELYENIDKIEKASNDMKSQLDQKIKEIDFILNNLLD